MTTYFQEYFQRGELTVEVWKHVSAEREHSVSLTTHVFRETFKERRGTDILTHTELIISEPSLD